MKSEFDGRSVFDPEEEVPDWFWKVIETGRKSRKAKQQACASLTQQQLADFIRRFDDLAGFFVEPPFVPPPVVVSTLNSLEETGWWVISQGKEFFMSVWQNPELFWKLMNDDVIESQPQKSFYGVPEADWSKRFPEEEMP